MKKSEIKEKEAARAHFRYKQEIEPALNHLRDIITLTDNPRDSVIKYHALEAIRKLATTCERNRR